MAIKYHFDVDFEYKITICSLQLCVPDCRQIKLHENIISFHFVKWNIHEKNNLFWWSTL